MNGGDVYVGRRASEYLERYDSAQPWFAPPDDALRYPKQPESFDALFVKFKAYFQVGDP